MLYSSTNIGNHLLYKFNGNKGNQQTRIRSMDLALAKDLAAGRAHCLQLMLLVQYEVCYGLNIQAKISEPGKYHNMAKVSKRI